MATIINDPYGSTGASLGSALGQGVGSGIQQLLANKLEQKQYQQKQLRQQQETSRMAKIFEQGGAKPEHSGFLAELFLKDPKAAEDAYKHLGALGKSAAEQLAETSEANKTKLGWAHQNLGEKKLELEGELGRGELEHKLGYDKQEFARKEKEFELERARDKAALEHTAHKENMDKQQIALKMKEIDQDYKNKREALNLEKEKIKTTSGENSMAEQKENYAEGKKFSDSISVDVHNAVEKKKEASKALRLLNTGKIYTGLIEGHVPLKLTNPETRQFDKAIANLITAKSREGGGVMSKAKMALTERGKASRDMQESAIREILEGEIKDADELGIGMGKIRDEIKSANNGRFPRDIEGKVLAEHQQRYPEYYQEYDKSSFNTPKGEPTTFKSPLEAPASNYPVGTKAQQNGKWYIGNGKNWIEQRV
jgi:hypothetical protein